uniref:Uncharacterized protein n=1 Tax=Timema bartmani TaxID=61472 RepID=A0A7R9EQK2_9NEOP|nr:unnamed protein product [Timema bartmani]
MKLDEERVVSRGLSSVLRLEEEEIIYGGGKSEFSRDISDEVKGEVCESSYILPTSPWGGVMKGNMRLALPCGGRIVHFVSFTPSPHWNFRRVGGKWTGDLEVCHWSQDMDSIILPDDIQSISGPSTIGQKQLATLYGAVVFSHAAGVREPHPTPSPSAPAAARDICSRLPQGRSSVCGALENALQTRASKKLRSVHYIKMGGEKSALVVALSKASL